MKLLNERYDYGLDLCLLSIDEGISGYRDDSLETVKRNSSKDQYDMPLRIVSYEELYGWTMDAIVEAVGRKNNCTFCGVFRRQALDRGAMLLGVDAIVTGHNADDIAETVLMNSAQYGGPLFRSTDQIPSFSFARRHCAIGALHCHHHRRRGHDSAFQAVQIHLRKGDCHVCLPQAP